MDVADMTIEDWRERFRALVEAHPDKRNPVNSDETCLYDDGKGNHCIVGQVLYDLDPGLCPGPDCEDPASLVLEWLGAPLAAARYVSNVQSAADHATTVNHQTWSSPTVLHAIENRRWDR